MGYQDTQQVCLNGHQITDGYNRNPQFRKAFCAECGEKTIHTCPKCDSPIKGDYYIENVFGFSSTSVPSHCDNCGSEFPWVQKKKELESIIDGKKGGAKPSILVNQLCSRFHLVAKQLETRHDNRKTLIIDDEYDVQDLFHALLRIYFDDVRDEEWTPSYAGRCSRVDFLLKDEEIVIEVKKTRETLKAKQLGEQLIIDIQRYESHKNCKHLVCFVYDPKGLIANPRGLENDLNRTNKVGLKVEVIIVPKGY